MLVLKDRNFGYVTANLVPRKGGDAFATKSLNRDLNKIGV